MTWRDKSEIVLIMGYPASGKTTLAKEYEEKGYTRLNRDIAGGKVNDLMTKLRSLMLNNKNVVVDNTFPTIPSREPFVKIAKEFFRDIHCIWIDISFEDAQLNACLRMMEKIGRLVGPNESLKDPNLFPPAVLFKHRKLFENKPEKGVCPVKEYPGKQIPKVEHGFKSVKRVKFERVWDKKFQRKALILDADATIRHSVGENPWPEKPSDVTVIDGVSEKIKGWMNKNRCKLLLGVSNQSAIDKGRVTASEVQACFQETNRQLGLDVHWLFSPYLPPKNISYCRKPHCGLGAKLIWDYNLLPERCLFVGDAKTDKTFAERCGFKYQHPDEFFK